MKILIVDNDINAIELLQVALRSKVNYEIDVAYGGEEALKKMKEGGHYDLLILDIMMPKISGLDVCDLMAKDEKLKNIPVFLISALPIASTSFRESLDKFKKLKLVKDVLEKPFEINNLVAKIRAILGE